MFAIESGIHGPKIFFFFKYRTALKKGWRLPLQKTFVSVYQKRTFKMRRCLLFYKIQLLFRPSSLLLVSNELRSLKDKKQAKIPRLNQITFLARQRTNKCKYREYVPPLTRSPAPRILNFIQIIKTVTLTLQNQIILLRSQRSLQFLISSRTAKAIKSSH